MCLHDNPYDLLNFPFSLSFTLESAQKRGGIPISSSSSCCTPCSNCSPCSKSSPCGSTPELIEEALKKVLYI